jgi:hypothetical protein
MFTVTMWSERCASLGSMGNSSRTQYPPQSAWSSVVPHVRCPVNHRLSILSVPNRLRSGQRARYLPPKGVNPGDFEAEDSNIGRDSRVAPHHRLEPLGPISFLPLSLSWPRALPRTGPGVDFLIMTSGRAHDLATQRTGLGALGPPSSDSRLFGAHLSCDHEYAVRSW